MAAGALRYSYEEAFRSISQSLKELGKGEGIPKLTSGERKRHQSFLCEEGEEKMNW